MGLLSPHKNLFRILPSLLGICRPQAWHFPLSLASFSVSEINVRVNQNSRRDVRRIFHELTVLPPLRSVAALTVDSDKTPTMAALTPSK